jgi:hypothetical protein
MYEAREDRKKAAEYYRRNLAELFFSTALSRISDGDSRMERKERNLG